MGTISCFRFPTHTRVTNTCTCTVKPSPKTLGAKFLSCLTRNTKLPKKDPECKRSNQQDSGHAFNNIYSLRFKRLNVTLGLLAPRNTCSDNACFGASCFKIGTFIDLHIVNGPLGKFMCVGSLEGVPYLRRYTMLMTPNKGEIAVHCCYPALSVLVMFGDLKRISALHFIIFNFEVGNGSCLYISQVATLVYSNTYMKNLTDLNQGLIFASVLECSIVGSLSVDMIKKAVGHGIGSITSGKWACALPLKVRLHTWGFFC